MTGKTFTYLALFYAMYFLGHFGMTMAYGMGPSGTAAAGAVLAGAVMVTLWKATGRSEGKKEMVWGIFSGFFLWCFFGEFLEHEGIISLAAGQAAVLLVPGLLLISYLIYIKYAPIGTRFALFHFGCVWLLHAILVNQEEVVKPHYPALSAILLPVTGLAFFLIALFMFFKTVRAGSERTLLAYLLPSFIFFWAAVETLQLMDVLPDYTCYAYWTKGSSSGTDASPWEQAVDDKIALIRERHAWKDKQAEKHAYSLLKRLPSPRFIDDFTVRLAEQMKREGKKHMNEELFYRVMEESFVKTAEAAFDRLLKGQIGQFKAAPSPGANRHMDYASYPGRDSPREDVEGKIAFIKERYTWETDQTRELAGYLLTRFSLQFLTGDTFIKKLDERLAHEKTDTLSEPILCRAMQECFTATSRTVFNNLRKTYLGQPDRKGGRL